MREDDERRADHVPAIDHRRIVLPGGNHIAQRAAQDDQREKDDVYMRYFKAFFWLFMVGTPDVLY